MFARDWLAAQWPSERPFTETEAMLWLASKVNYRPSEFADRGEIPVGMLNLAETFGWTRSRVRAFIKKMERRGDMVTRSTKAGTIIRLPLLANDSDHGTTTERPSKDHKATTPAQQNQQVTEHSDHGTTTERPESDHGAPLLNKEQGNKEEQNTPGADGNELPGVEGEDEEKDEKPKKPPIAAWNEWPAVKANQKWVGYSYPEAFNDIWSIWRQTAKRNLNVKAVGKADSYRLCLRWLHEGYKPEQLLEATKGYLRPFYAKPDKTHCQHPTTVYSHAHPTLPDRLDNSPLSPPSMTQPMRKRWSAPYTAWNSCVTVCNDFDLPIPEKDGTATWNDVEKFHPLVIANASDDHQLRRPPEDLRQQVMQ